MREMKESGNIWLGNIPKNWDLHKFKEVTIIFNGNSISDSKKDNYLDENNARPYVSSKDIDATYLIANYDNGMYVKKDDYSFRVATKNSTLMCIEGGSAGKKKTFLEQDVTFVNKLCCFTGNDKIDSKFLFYYLCSPNYEDEFKNNLSGLIGGVSVSTLKNIQIVVPSIVEQKVIANFLDKKCSEIDAVTKDIEKQIEVLEDYKKSVITEAVTKGLNPNVEMKDTGIEYVGLIPASWEIHPIYYYFVEGKNKNRFLKEQNLLSLSYGKIKRKDINTSEGLLPESFNTYNIVEKDDIIIRPTDLQNDKRSLRTGLVTERGIITSAYLDLKPSKRINSKYFHYLLHAFDVEKVFYNMGNGVRQGLNYDEFSRLLVFGPSLNEQNSIVKCLDSKCMMLENLILDKQKQLSLLADYKKSLIYEYVTGKKEVM